MRQNYLQKEFYQLAKKPVIKPGETARQRMRLLKAWEALRKQGMNGKQACEVVEVSRATLYRWCRRLKEQGWKGLEQKSRRPGHVRKVKWQEEAVEGVRSLRRLYPCWGKEKIKVLLAEDGIQLSASTVGRIISYLKARHEIPEVKYKKRWRGKRTAKRPYAIRKPKEYRVEKPGDLVQVDTLDIHPFPGVHFKHFTARDVISRWDVIELFPQASSIHAKAFLQSLLNRSPYQVKAVQVDGGSEFMACFEEACRDLDLKLFVLPPRSPKLNGRVERAHRTHLDEFYAVYDLDFDLDSINRALRKWEWIYNHIRPHRALDNYSPSQYIKLHHPDLTPPLSHMS